MANTCHHSIRKTRRNTSRCGARRQARPGPGRRRGRVRPGPGRAGGTGSLVSFKPGQPASRPLVFLLCASLVPPPQPRPLLLRPSPRAPAGDSAPAPPPQPGGGPGAPAWAQSGSSSPRPSPGSSFPSFLFPPFSSSPLLLSPLSPPCVFPPRGAGPPEDAGALAGDPSTALTFSRFAVRGAGRSSPPGPPADTSCPPPCAAGRPELGPAPGHPTALPRVPSLGRLPAPVNWTDLGVPPRPPLRATGWEKAKCNKSKGIFPAPLASGYRNSTTGLRLFTGPSGKWGQAGGTP